MYQDFLMPSYNNPKTSMFFSLNKPNTPKETSQYYIYAVKYTQHNQRRPYRVFLMAEISKESQLQLTLIGALTGSLNEETMA